MTSDSLRKKRLVVALIAAAVMGLLTAVFFSASSLLGALGPLVVFLLFPGIIGAMAFSNNVHAWHAWVAVATNPLFYFLVVWGVYSALVLLARESGSDKG